MPLKQNFREIKLLSKETKSYETYVDTYTTNLLNFVNVKLKRPQHIMQKLFGSWRHKNHNIDTYLRSHIRHDYKNLCFEMNSHFFQEPGFFPRRRQTLDLRHCLFKCLSFHNSHNHHHNKPPQFFKLVKLTEQLLWNQIMGSWGSCPRVWAACFLLKPLMLLRFRERLWSTCFFGWSLAPLLLYYSSTTSWADFPMPTRSSPAMMLLPTLP